MIDNNTRKGSIQDVIQHGNPNETYFEESSNETSSRLLSGQYVEQDKEEALKASDLREDNNFIMRKRLYMLPMITMVLFGSQFNSQFQSFIKQQLMDSMNMSSNQYSWFVLIPTFPNIILPLLVGPILQKVGARIGLIFFTILLCIGLLVCIFSVSISSVPLLILGKSVFQIGSENQGIAQGVDQHQKFSFEIFLFANYLDQFHGGKGFNVHKNSPYIEVIHAQTRNLVILLGVIVGKWYGAKGLTSTFSLTSLFCKISSSLAGIIYPQLYDLNGTVETPLIVGLSICVLTVFLSIGIFFLDRKSDNFADASANLIVDPGFQIRDLLKFDKLYWMYSIQSLLTWGGFYGFMNYLQSIFIHKFFIGDTYAGELVSIPYWIAFSAPIFGILTDRYSKRCSLLCVAASMSLIPVFILYVTPQGSDHNGILYFSLILFGLFLSMMCSLLFPTLPLISEKRLLSTAFGLCYCTKNGGTALLSFLGGQLLGDDDQGYDKFLLTYIFIFSLSVGLSMVIHFYDYKHGSIINSTTPQRYIQHLEQCRQRKSEEVCQPLIIA